MGLRVGSWLENTRLPLLTVIRFLYSWSQELSSIQWCARELQISAGATIAWNAALRDVCVASIERRSQQKIGGPGMIVEIDETMFSRRKNHAGRILPQQWVFGGVCRETKACFALRVPDRTATTLLQAIKDNIAEGSMIYSDCWRGYRTQDLEAAGFSHLTVNHKYNFVDPRTGTHTQNIERLWGSAKWRNKRQRGTARSNLDSYLVEFLWRQSVRGSDVFATLLSELALATSTAAAGPRQQ